MKKLYRQLAPIFIAIIIIVAAPLLQKAHAASTNTPWRDLTQAQLTAVWWQWLFSIPEHQSPVYDNTGEHACNGQPYSDLLFLAGTFQALPAPTGDVVGEATRGITVGQGTALFVPIINAELDNICAQPNLGGNCSSAQKYPNVQGFPALKAAVAAYIGSAIGYYAILTPTDQTFTPPQCADLTQCSNVSYARLQSPSFSYTLPAADNLYQYIGTNVSGTVAPVAGDGYYALIPAGDLTPGHYLLQFGGKAPLNDKNYFIEAITYKITVTTTSGCLGAIQ